MTPRPFIPVVNTVKVEMRYIWFNQQCENVFYVDRGSLAIEEALTAIAAAVATWAGATLMPLISNDVTLVSIKITDMSAADGPVYTYTTGLPINGGVNTSAAPNNVSLAVKLMTSYRGRNNTGRQFLLGIPQNAITGNVVGSVFQLAVKAAYEALISSLEDAGGLLEIVSFVIAGVLRTTGLKAPVLSVGVDSTTDSQRRRLPGRGR